MGLVFSELRDSSERARRENVEREGYLRRPGPRFRDFGFSCVGAQGRE